MSFESLRDVKIGFLGAGNIAGVWIERLVSARVFLPGNIFASDIRSERLEMLHARWGIATSAKNSEIAQRADLVILAVPPGKTLPVLQEVFSSLRTGQIILSLAAAVPLCALEELARGLPVVRVMPNTPALVGEAMNLVVFGSGLSPVERTRVTELLDAFGEWFEVPDDEVDRWCALCAVGPTYVLPIIEALVSAAVAQGLSRERALAATAQLIAGTGQMVRQSGQTPEQLKQLIGLRTLREAETCALFTQAYEEAVNKLRGLGMSLVGAA